jgi:ATP synthase protein I
VAGGADGERPDLRRAIERDAQRRARRDPSSRSFWRALSVLGVVGWSIALPAAGGALLGRSLDQRFATGVRFTLMLLFGGVVLGAIVAWNAVQRSSDGR